MTPDELRRLAATYAGKHPKKRPRLLRGSALIRKHDLDVFAQALEWSIDLMLKAQEFTPTKRRCEQIEVFRRSWRRVQDALIGLEGRRHHASARKGKS